jgi:hypothetical protein
MFESIENTLSNSFETITLKEMDNVKLMDRTDTKYSFHISGLNDILLEVKEHYKLLTVEHKIISKYKTLYYDTQSLSLYNQHQTGKLNRYKIRHRTYVESNLGFLEVKFKNNKGRTIKERIKKLEVPQEWDDNSKTFLDTSLPFESNNLVPIVWVNYSRITLVNKHAQERVTIDLGMKFIKDNLEVDLSTLVIVEVKQDSKKSSIFCDVLKNHHIREGSLSKYCMAVAFTNQDVKKNAFKMKLNQINKILNYASTTNSERPTS